MDRLLRINLVEMICAMRELSVLHEQHLADPRSVTSESQDQMMEIIDMVYNKLRDIYDREVVVYKH